MIVHRWQFPYIPTKLKGSILDNFRFCSYLNAGKTIGPQTEMFMLRVSFTIGSAQNGAKLIFTKLRGAFMQHGKSGLKQSH